jgi:hypothetical protein
MQLLESQTSTSNTPNGDENMMSDTVKELTLLDLMDLSFRSEDGQLTNCDDCTAEEFREFIAGCVVLPENVNLDALADRRDILNFILSGPGPKPQFQFNMFNDIIRLDEAEEADIMSELLGGGSYASEEEVHD